MPDHNIGHEAFREGPPPEGAMANDAAATPGGSSKTWMQYVFRRRRKLFLLAVLIFPALLYAVWWCSIRFSGPPVVNNALVSQSEEQIRREYGAPVWDVPGYRTLGLDDPPPLPGTQIRSLKFHPGILWHPKGGTLRVWLVQEKGKWLCFESCWFADDVDF